MRRVILRSIFYLSFIVVGLSVLSPICIGSSSLETETPPVKKWVGGNREADMRNADFKGKMIILIEQISTYAKMRNPSFQLIGNNGLDLFRPEKVGSQFLERLLSSVDGIIMEEFHYGWEMNDDRRTPASVKAALEHALTVPRARKLPVLNIDYCQNRRNIDKAYKLNDESGFIAFAADSRELDRIPQYPQRIYRENDNDISNLGQVKNFIVLFDPHKFPDKCSYLESLRNTNYDLLIIDMYFDDERLSSSDVASLKVKKNGASRLVFAYMSVGEAEDYRNYWQSSWSQNPPDWVAENNPDWPGNFKVKYWTREWQQLLFGSPHSYLDMILAAGFDGVFMDVIDAFEYFEDQ